VKRGRTPASGWLHRLLRCFCCSTFDRRSTKPDLRQIFLWRLRLRSRLKTKRKKISAILVRFELFNLQELPKANTLDPVQLNMTVAVVPVVPNCDEDNRSWTSGNAVSLLI